ncbi:MAG: helix-turn-helix domain-containing protein [Bacteroidales bacterium]|nr:helix-turn-helix domain-containing protein [Bacteroidales bacterium]
MTEPYHEIDIARLAKITGVSEVTRMSDEFIITKICGKDAFSLLKYPVRFKAYAAVYCTRGSFDIDINTTTFRVRQDTMLFYVPGSTMQIKESEIDKLMDSEAILVIATKDFLKSGQINFDFFIKPNTDYAHSNLDGTEKGTLKKNGLFSQSIRLLNNPCITIDEEGKRILSDYYTLVNDLYKTGLLGVKEAICSIGTSLICLLGNIWTGELSKYQTSRPAPSRTQVKYEEFLALVSENFMTEKSVAFYAEKMYMTPKYLTTLVKNVSGKTATDWIDTFLVLEAKNLLKYSDLTAKEIGYRLNFRSIPSFHKFFKSQTGLTPNEYRLSE